MALKGEEDQIGIVRRSLARGKGKTDDNLKLAREALAAASEHRDGWISWAIRSKLKPFVKLARTIQKFKDGIVAYVRTRLSKRMPARKKKHSDERERFAWLAKRERATLRELGFLRPLRRRLLSLGGRAVILWNGNNSPIESRYLLAQGRVSDKRGLKLIKGAPSSCHDNALAWWHKNKSGAVMTGYALSRDGVWRPHSWGLTARGTIVETTERRIVYFGADIRPLLEQEAKNATPRDATPGEQNK